MKLNTILVGITLSLLLALPVAASDYTLGVFGNANEDDTINMQDVTQIELVILGKEKEMTVIDPTDHIVTVNKPLQKIVVFAPCQFETLRALGVSDRIIAIADDNIWDPAFFPEISELPGVGTKWNADIEAILALSPDAVILSTDYRQLNMRKRLEEANPPFQLLSFGCHDQSLMERTEFSPWSYQDEVRMLGYIFGKVDEAKELIEFRENVFNSITDVVETIPEADRTKVYLEHHGKYKIRGGNAISNFRSFVPFAGGDDIFADEPGGIVDAESVMSLNPDIIIKLGKSTSEGVGGYRLDVDDTECLAGYRDEVMNRPELQNVEAVKSGNVYAISNDLPILASGAGGARYFIITAYCAKCFYPYPFEDLDPKAIHQEYLTRFQGLDIDLDEQGVVWYPEPS